VGLECVRVRARARVRIGRVRVRVRKTVRVRIRGPNPNPNPNPSPNPNLEDGGELRLDRTREALVVLVLVGERDGLLRVRGRVRVRVS